MPRALETNAGIASFLQTAEFFGLGLDYDLRLPDLLSAVTLDEANEAARRVLEPRPRRDRRGRTVPGVTIRAVFFDVDFTLIYPGPTFRGEGYRAFCARHGMDVDVDGVRSRGRQRRAASRQPASADYDAEIFVALHAPHHRTDGRARRAARRVRARDLRRVGSLPALRAVRRRGARVFARSTRAGLRIGLISNSHRCLASFQSHFELDGLIAGAVSSSGARPDEAAPEHLSARRSISWMCPPERR